MGGNVKGGPIGGGVENHEATALKVGDNTHNANLHLDANMANPANKVPVDATGHQSAQATLDKMFGTPGIEGTGINHKNPENMTADAATPKPETVAYGVQDRPVETTIGNDTKVATQGTTAAEVNQQLDKMTA